MVAEVHLEVVEDLAEVDTALLGEVIEVVSGDEAEVALRRIDGYGDE